MLISTGIPHFASTKIFLQRPQERAAVLKRRFLSTQVHREVPCLPPESRHRTCKCVELELSTCLRRYAKVINFFISRRAVFFIFYTSSLNWPMISETMPLDLAQFPHFSNSSRRINESIGISTSDIVLKAGIKGRKAQALNPKKYPV